MNEILLKEIEVADAYSESAISNAWLEACMTFMESEASDRLKNAKADIVENLAYVIDSVIEAIENFFEMLKEKLEDICFGISDAVGSTPKLSPRYRMLLHECEAAYANYLKNLEKVLLGDIRSGTVANKAYFTDVTEASFRKDCMQRVQKAVRKALSLKSSTVDMLTDDIFDRLEKMAVQFQRNLRVKTRLVSEDPNRPEQQLIKYASMQAARLSREIPREMLKAI